MCETKEKEREMDGCAGWMDTCGHKIFERVVIFFGFRKMKCVLCGSWGGDGAGWLLGNGACNGLDFFCGMGFWGWEWGLWRDGLL